MQLVAMDPAHYLASDEVIESKAPAVVRLASELRSTYGDDVAFAQAAYARLRRLRMSGCGIISRTPLMPRIPG